MFKCRPYLYILFFLTLATSCCYRPTTEHYQNCYSHLELTIPVQDVFEETDYYVLFLVDARHLDYYDSRTFIKTIAKHPSDGSKSGDVGHAWIYLHGWKNGKKINIEGGHSGERGVLHARYWQGVLNHVECGYANPSDEERKHPRHEPNPVKYLWEEQADGFFEKGSGHHRPTFAAKVDLTEEQFRKIMLFLSSYNYQNYSLTGQQCCSFVAQVCELAGVPIEHQVTLSILQKMKIGDYQLQLWEDEKYSKLTFSSPDIVEKELMKLVLQDKAHDAMDWYLENGDVAIKPGMLETIKKFPGRISRYLLL